MKNDIETIMLDLGLDIVQQNARVILGPSSISKVHTCGSNEIYYSSWKVRAANTHMRARIRTRVGKSYAQYQSLHI